MSYIQNKLDELIETYRKENYSEYDVRMVAERLATDYHNHTVEKFKCGECNGSGAYSSPYDYSPCRHCDGTGFNIINGCFNDILQDTNQNE